MKFDLDAKQFTAAVAWAMRGVPSRPPVPILSGVKITAQEGSVTIGGFDYETAATMTVPADVAEPGVTLVPGKRLKEMVSKLTGVVTAHSAGGKLTLTVGKAFRALNELDDKEYPQLPALPDQTWPVDAALLASAIQSVAPAASHDDTLPRLTGVLLKSDGGTLDVVATDRYRLHIATVPWPGGKIEAIIPARELVAVTKVFKTGMLGVHAASTGTDGDAVTFTDGMRTLRLRVIKGEFIKYSSRMPSEDSARSHLTCDAAVFADAASRVGALAERGMPLEVHADKSGTVTLQVHGDDHAVSGETFDGAELEGGILDVGFNPAFLIDAVAAHPGKVTMHVNGIKPVLFTSGDSGVTCLVVPLRMPPKAEEPQAETAEKPEASPGE